VLLVASRYNATVMDRLIDGAVEDFSDRASPGDELEVAYAPGSFEIPAIALAGADSGRFDGVVTLGCIIKGDTIHDRVLADAVTQALVQITLLTGVPVTLGVLTVNTPQQALERAGGKLGNKGAEAMSALFDTLGSIDQVQSGVAPAPASARPDKLARSGDSPRVRKRGAGVGGAR
jgi:6,7-dimethyl-8-ribityllumazine synthase